MFLRFYFKTFIKKNFVKKLKKTLETTETNQSAIHMYSGCLLCIKTIED